MSGGRLAILVACAAPLLAAPSRAREDEDEGPLRVMSSGEIDLRRRREAQPVLVCEPGSLRATLKQDRTAALRLTIRNAGGRTLRWLVSSAPRWLAPEVRSGRLGFEESAILVLTVDPAGLPVGGTRDSITVEAPGALGSPVTVPVTVQVVGVRLRESPGPPEPGGPRAERERRGLVPAPGPERRFSLSLGFGTYMSMYGPGAPAVSAEFRRGPHAFLLEWDLDIGDLPANDYDVWKTYEVHVWESVRAVYRHYGKPRGPRRWFWQAGVQRMRMKVSLFAGGAENEYEAVRPVVGGGGRWRRSWGKASAWAEFSWDLVLGEGPDPVEFDIGEVDPLLQLPGTKHGYARPAVRFGVAF